MNYKKSKSKSKSKSRSKTKKIVRSKSKSKSKSRSKGRLTERHFQKAMDNIKKDDQRREKIKASKNKSKSKSKSKSKKTKEPGMYGYIRQVVCEANRIKIEEDRAKAKRARSKK